MNKYVFVFFIVFGLIDFLYGIFYHDQISLVVGPVIIAITVYMAKSKKRSD